MDTTTPPLACVPGAPCDVTVLTWNMHKGRDAKRRPVDLGRLAEALASVQADVLLLQEVFHAWTGVSQSGELARRLDMHAAYVPNARYARGHHGNATLASAALPLVRHRDISTNAYEHRGLLHVHFELPGRPHIHVMNTHLGLNAVQRRRQVHGIARFVAEHVPPGEPWVLGGDFNDWTMRLDAHVVRRLRAQNLMAGHGWRARCTYPVRRPLLPLDRLYAHGLHVEEASVLRGEPWTSLSDHLPIRARLVWPTLGVG